MIITGATGKLGEAIVEGLLERVPASQIGVSVREPHKAQALSERGVRVRQGDFTDARSLHHAFDGASLVLIVSSNSLRGDMVNQHRTAIEAAQTVGCQRVLYTSHMGARLDSAFTPMIDNAATDAILQELSGTAFTSLHNGFYAQSALQLLGGALESGQLIAPEDGPVSWTAHPDLAAAAVLALTQEGELDGITPPLTGSQALDLADIANLASNLTERTITRITVTDAEYRQGLVSYGVPEEQIAVLLGLFAASRQGEFAAVDPTLERLLGRPPMTMRDVLANHIAHWLHLVVLGVAKSSTSSLF